MAKPPPPVVQKKSGCGCFGCGCAILGLIAVLLLGLVAAGGYLFYTQAILGLTSTTAATVPTFDGGDDVYQGAMQKVTDFHHDLNDHQAATLSLSADEINTLVARNPELSKNNIHFFLIMNDDKARIQSSVPTGILSQGLLKDRYLNSDFSFNLNFDPGSESLDVGLQSLQVGSVTAPPKDLPFLQSELNELLNMALQKDQDVRSMLLQAKSIQIKDGQLVIETQ